MLFSDSLPQLWLSYGVLSLIVLVTGYLGVRWLPLLPRLIVLGVVAGGLWMVAPFSLPLLQPGETYSGLAPAIVVMAVGVVQHDGGQVAGALPLLLVGAVIGAALGLMAWRLLVRRRGDENDDAGNGSGRSRRPSRERSASQTRPRRPARKPEEGRGKPGERREPVVN
ncbi:MULTISPECIES: hypothetical protein [Salinicola]|uniref:Uncharacterized protein n=1 Tax=Salinicola socius TaxID=404433 RepID=A0A1Q8SQN4_9GAMM|nr:MULTISPECIES: hypothetical protein [Salinicola]OLO03714.1 hypothetical protein BTW07_12505 [Salinicola socius]